MYDRIIIFMFVAQTSKGNTLGYQVYFLTTLFSRMYYYSNYFPPGQDVYLIITVIISSRPGCIIVIIFPSQPEHSLGEFLPKSEITSS